ncbi:MAG: serine hydrolase domain-containing protein, partial [Candidatus Saccharimonadales bacterium]
VLPEQDTVVAITSGVRDMQSVLNLVWDKLLPGLQPSALPADEAGANKLAVRIKGLSLRAPQAAGTPPAVVGKKYVFPANERKLEAITLESGGNKLVTLGARVDGREQRIECGSEWRKARLAWGRAPEQPAAASGAWTSDDTFTAKLCFYETPFTATVRLKFTGDEVRCASESNVGFGSPRETELVGKVVADAK